jgi:alpha-glucosidase
MATVIYQFFVGAFGGLDGVVAHLDHVAELGADAVYLTPIFRAPSLHKYDTADFDAVDEGFGGEAAWQRLVAETRRRKLGLILDGVFNHVGETHAWAARSEWLRGTPWRGYGHLRELALGHADVGEALFGSDGVVARWTRRGATGWRLDCANDLPPEARRRAAECARLAGAVDGVVGEVMAYPRGFADGDGLDGVMGYWLRSIAVGEITAGQAQHALDRLAAEIPLPTLLNSWTVLSSHDTPRLAHQLDDARAHRAFGLALAFPGIVHVYYGEECGMPGGPDPDNRHPLVDKSQWNQARLTWLRGILPLRRSLPALQRGAYLPLPQPGTDLVAFARVTDRPSETLIFVASFGAEGRRRLMLSVPHLYDAVPLVDVLNGPPARLEAGAITVELPTHGAALFRIADADPSGYRFYK